MYFSPAYNLGRLRASMQIHDAWQEPGNPARRTRPRLKLVMAASTLAMSIAGAAAATPGFYVSSSGNDSNDGSESQPFATFARAQSAMQGSATKITRIEDGTYYFTAPLTLSAADNGESWMAALNAHPVISGGQVITGWISQGNSIYTAPASSPVGIDLSIDGVRQYPADKGYGANLPFISGWRLINTAQPICQPDQNGFSNCFYALPQDAANLIVGSSVQIMDDSRYAAVQAVVTGVNQESGMITTGWPYFQQLNKGSWRLLGNPADISADADFGYAPGPGGEPGTVTLQSAAPPDSRHVVAAALKSLIVLNGTSNIAIGGMHFQDTTTSYGRGGAGIGGVPAACTVGAITGTGLNDVSITGNTFLNVGNGIYVCGSTNGNFSSNRFVALNGVGIRLEATSNNGTVTGSENRIVGNQMEDLGQVTASSTGVDIVGDTNDVVDSNTISRSGSHAIGFSTGSFCTISNNTLFANSQQTDDTASIYVEYEEKNNEEPSYHNMQISVTGNRIENLGGLTRDVSNSIATSGIFTQGSSRAIYFDDHVSASTAAKNVVEAHGAGIFLCHGCDGNTAVNNLVVIQPQAYYHQIGARPVLATPDMNFLGRDFVAALPSYFPAGLKDYTITWQFSGTASNGQPPAFEVQVDGKTIGRGLASTGIVDYPFNAKAAPYTEHLITLVLNNGSPSGTPTQSLHNISLFINGSAVPLEKPSDQSAPYGLSELTDDFNPTDVTIESNIIYRASGPGVDNNFAVPGNYVDRNPGLVDYNVIFNRTLGFENSSPHLNGEVINAHSINANPRLTNPAIGDYRLLADSPALSRGFATDGVPLAPP